MQSVLLKHQGKSNKDACQVQGQIKMGKTFLLVVSEFLIAKHNCKPQLAGMQCVKLFMCKYNVITYVYKRHI